MRKWLILKMRISLYSIVLFSPFLLSLGFWKKEENDFWLVDGCFPVRLCLFCKLWDHDSLWIICCTFQVGIFSHITFENILMKVILAHSAMHPPSLWLKNLKSLIRRVSGTSAYLRCPKSLKLITFWHRIWSGIINSICWVTFFFLWSDGIDWDIVFVGNHRYHNRNSENDFHEKILRSGFENILTWKFQRIILTFIASCKVRVIEIWVISD